MIPADAEMYLKFPFLGTFTNLFEFSGHVGGQLPYPFPTGFFSCCWVVCVNMRKHGRYLMETVRRLSLTRKRSTTCSSHGL